MEDQDGVHYQMLLLCKIYSVFEGQYPLSLGTDQGHFYY